MKAWGMSGTTDSQLCPKTHICLGAWNVHTMFETSKTAQVISETYCNGQAKRDGLNKGQGTMGCKGPVPLETDCWEVLCPTRDEEDYIQASANMYVSPQEKLKEDMLGKCPTHISLQLAAEQAAILTAILQCNLYDVPVVLPPSNFHWQEQ